MWTWFIYTSIYNVRIHWRLLVKFSCNFYEILCSWVCLNNLLVILTSSYQNTIEIPSLANVYLLLQHWLRHFKKSVSIIILKLGGLNSKAFKSIVLLNILSKLIEKIIAKWFQFSIVNHSNLHFNQLVGVIQ